MHERIGEPDNERMPNLRPSTTAKNTNRHSQKNEPCFNESDNACKFFLVTFQFRG